MTEESYAVVYWGGETFEYVGVIEESKRHKHLELICLKTDLDEAMKLAVVLAKLEAKQVAGEVEIWRQGNKDPLGTM